MKIHRIAAWSLVLLALAAPVVLAQSPGGDLGSQTLRPYAHVFAAYAVVWVLVGGWILSIHRRLGRLEREARN